MTFFFCLHHKTRHAEDKIYQMCGNMRKTLQEFLGTNMKHLANFEHTWIFQICFKFLSFGAVGVFFGR